MPYRVEICLSVAITVGVHIGLGDQAGHAIDNFLGLFTDFAPLPALYVGYSLCVWLSVLAACIAIRHRLFDRRRVPPKPSRKRKRPTGRPQSLSGNTTGTQHGPVQPALLPNLRQGPSTRSNKGEQARRLREVRSGGQPHRIPVYSNCKVLLWDSPYPKTSPLGATNILTNKVNLPKPAAVSAESLKPPVPVSGQPPVVAPVHTRQHRHRVSPGPYLPFSPATCLRGAYDEEFNRWRVGEAKREKLCSERGFAFVGIPFDPTGSKARAALAKAKLAVTAPKPIEEPSAPAVGSTTEPSAKSSGPVPIVVEVSAVDKVKARIEKVKTIKDRARAVLGRQVETMSLLDNPVRSARVSTPGSKRKLRNPRRSFEPKPVKRTFVAMEVDYSADSMDVDLPCPVDQLADIFARFSFTECKA